MKKEICAQFNVDATSSFLFYVPEKKYKFNSFIKPTDKLDSFDYVDLVYQENGTTYLIEEDTLVELLCMLRNKLLNIFFGKQSLPSMFKVGFVGLSSATDSYKDDLIRHRYYNCFCVWATKYIKIWLYTKNDEIYIEISPYYKWCFQDPEPGEHYYSFEKFLRNYKAIAVKIISKKNALKWIEHATHVMKQANASQGNFVYDKKKHKKIL
jgi:hypothetical protein